MDIREEWGLVWEKAEIEVVWKRSWKQSQGQSDIVTMLWLRCILNKISELPIKSRSRQRMDLNANSAFVCYAEEYHGDSVHFPYWNDQLKWISLVSTSTSLSHPPSFLIHVMTVPYIYNPMCLKGSWSRNHRRETEDFYPNPTYTEN